MEKTICIEYAQVPKHKWRDLEFLSILAFRIRDVQQELSAPTAVQLLCVHEAGHVIYWEKLGLTVRHDGPTLSYVADFDRWTFYIATIPSPSPTTLKANYQNLSAIAKSAVAGGEFVRSLLSSEDDAGDRDDRYRFGRVCGILRENAQKHHKYLCFNEDKIWAQAQIAVLKDLKDAEFQSQARERAQRISRELFQ
jgi:hypothetical protein